MERLNRTCTLAGCGLALILAVSGCRTPKSGVPPGRNHPGATGESDGVGFSTQPNQTGSPNFYGQTPTQGQAADGGNTYGGAGRSPGGTSFGIPGQATENSGGRAPKTSNPPVGGAAAAGSRSAIDEMTGP